MLWCGGEEDDAGLVPLHGVGDRGSCRRTGGRALVGVEAGEPVSEMALAEAVVDESFGFGDVHCDVVRSPRPLPCKNRRLLVGNRIGVGHVTSALQSVSLPPAQFVFVAHSLLPAEARGHAEQA